MQQATVVIGHLPNVYLVVEAVVLLCLAVHGGEVEELALPVRVAGDDDPGSGGQGKLVALEAKQKSL